MKAFVNLTTLAIILELSNTNADANPTERGLKRGAGGAGEGEGGGGGGGLRGEGFGDRRDGKRKAIKSMIEKECKPESTCSDVDANSLDCTFESPERDERPDWDSQTDEEIAKRKAVRDERLQRILQCVCCTDATVEELLHR